MQPVTHILDLPNDVLKVIMTFLDVKSLVIASTACKRFQQVTHPPENIVKKRHVIELTSHLGHHLNVILAILEDLAEKIEEKVDDHPILFPLLESYYGINLLKEVKDICRYKKKCKNFSFIITCLQLNFTFNRNLNLQDIERRIFIKLLKATNKCYLIKKGLESTSRNSDEIWSKCNTFFLVSGGAFLLMNYLTIQEVD
jgi:hypothetical protein